MSYVLGARSMAQLQDVHPALVRTVKRAIQISVQDFAVHDGLRTSAEQRVLIDKGMSWTANSRHLRQPDGYAHAVDVVPFIAGRLSWDWAGCYDVASAMSEASAAEEIVLRWGGVWDRTMKQYGRFAEDARKASSAYVERRLRKGQAASIDGVHFELVR